MNPIVHHLRTIGHSLVDRAAPRKSARRRVLKTAWRQVAGLIGMGSGLPMNRWSDGPRIDVYDRKAFGEFLTSCEAPALTWSPDGVAECDWQAARMCLALLQEEPKLRGQFPRALSDGPEGAYCQWLCTSAAASIGLSDKAIARIRSVFSRRLGTRPLKIYDYDASLGEALPLALTPLQIGTMAQHLFKHCRQKQALSNEEICWFLFERAEDPFAGLVATYLRTPEWQKQFPMALTVFGWDEFVAWSRKKFAFDPRWLRAKSAPRILHPVDQVRQLANFTASLRSIQGSSWQPGAGVKDLARDLMKLKPGHPLLDSQWQAELRTGMDQGLMDQPGINLLGPLCYPAGNGESTRLVAEACTIAGIRTSCRSIPASHEFDRPSHDDYLGLEVFDYTVLLLAPEPDLHMACTLSRLHPREGVYRIPIWYWELESVPPELTRHAAQFGEVWAGSSFVGRALRKTLKIPVIDMIPGMKLPSFSPLPRRHFGLDDDRCLFLFCFDMCSVMERKNPLALIEAFRRAFRSGEKASLAIKVSRGSYDPVSFARLRQAADEAGVRIIDAVYPRNEVCALINSCDCYVSLHRSEGFGQTMAESMLMGKPTIATGYSGNLDFMTPTNSLLVDHDLVPITQELPYYKKGNIWAEPSVDHAAAHMRWVYEHRDEARALGLRAQSETHSLLSLEATGERMARRLRQLEADRRKAAAA